MLEFLVLIVGVVVMIGFVAGVFCLQAALIMLAYNVLDDHFLHYPHLTFIAALAVTFLIGVVRGIFSGGSRVVVTRESK